MKQKWLFTGICLTALLAVFLLWWRATPPTGVPAAAASILVTALFAFLGVRFIPRWIEAWSGGEDKTVVAPTDLSMFLKIFGALLLTRIVVLALSLVMHFIACGFTDAYTTFRNIWSYGDGYHYVDIAQYWYRSTGYIDEVVRLVFLPFYPILVRIFGTLTGHFFMSAMVISQLSFSLAGFVLYKTARLDMGHRDALRVLRYLVIMPSALFFSAPMSDSLFLLLSVTCIYFTRKKEYLTAAIFGGLAAFTRSLGLALFAPVCFEFIADTIREVKTKKFSPARTIIHGISLLIIPLGFSIYLYINYTVSGNPFQYLIYQSEHWGQELGWFFNTVAYQTHDCIDAFKAGHALWSAGLWIPNLIFIFGSLAVITAQAKFLRPSYVAYYIAYFVICIGATWLLSAPRYLASMFPICIALAGLTKKRSTDNIVTGALVAGAVYYLWAYVNTWSVY